jgi:hypothetical protein
MDSNKQQGEKKQKGALCPHVSLGEVTISIKSLLQSKVYLSALILVTIAAFGFEVTHFSLGHDDFGVNQYLNFESSSYGNMLQQGRLTHLILYYLTGLVDVVPFLNNFLSAALLAFSSLLLMALFDTAAGGQFTTSQKILFSSLYVSYPIIAFKFIYDLDVVVTMLGYVLVALATIFGFAFLQSRRYRDAIIAVVCLFFGIGAYESFNAVFVCIVLFTLIMLVLFRETGFRSLVKWGLILAIILVISFAAYYGAVKVLQALTNNMPYERTTLFNSGFPILRSLKQIAVTLFNPQVFFAIEFVVIVFLAFIEAIYFSIRHQRISIFLLFAVLGLFTFFVPIIQMALYYRICQTFNLVVAGIVLLALEILRNRRAFRVASICVVALLVVWQLRDINLWFFQDWANYQKSVYAINRIATDLQAGFDVEEKPVCFANRNYEHYLMTWDAEKNQYEIGSAPLITAVDFLGESTSPDLIQLFKYQEYRFLIEPTPAQAEMAKEHSKNMPGYPEPGYIEEFQGIIIVNIGDIRDQ